MLGRRGLALLDGSAGKGQRLTFRQLRQGLILGFFVRLRIFQPSAVGSVQRPPAVIFHCAALGGKLRTGALHRGGGLRKGIGLGNGAQQPQGHQLQHRLFAQRQAGQVRALEVAGGDHRMVVGHFLVIDDLGRIAGNLHTTGKGQRPSGEPDQLRQAGRHIRSQVTAVRPGIGAELLFIQVLQIVQGLLGGVSQQPVGVSLEGGQVIKGGRLLGLVLVLHLFHRGSRTLTSSFQLLGGGLVRHALPGNRETGQLQRDRVKRHRLEGVDLGLPLDDEGQRRGHDAPDIDGPVVQHRKQPGGVDTHQPICLGAAEGRIPQTVIVRAGAQVRKALPDGGILHRGNPEPLHGLLAARQLVDGAEDQLALASGVAGVHHLGHIRGVHQLFQHIKLLPFVLAHHHLPMVRQNGQIVIAPLCVVGVISVGVGQPSQMAHTPAYPPAVPLQIAVLAGSGPDHGGQTLGNGRFLSDHQLHGFSSSFPAAMRSAAGGRIPRRADRHGNFRSHNRGGREIK